MDELEYTRVNWKPEKTALNAKNLNTMDVGIANCVAAINSIITGEETVPFADKAIKDEDGNNIKETYAKKTEIKTINNESLLGNGNIEIKDLEEITWSELKSLRDSSQLTPGKFYRITDYECTTTTPNTSSAGHQFDIIVRADSTNKLNEEASAILHSGDTYFANSKLEAWKIWYGLDNDTTRFTWADSTNGKGVIYRMIDEFGNDVPYDFKNILFTNSEEYTNAYTFSYTEDNIIKDASLLASKNCYSNIIKESINTNRHQLNFNVFYSTSASFSCNRNTLENDCQHNTFGNGCYANTIGNNCHDNVFGNSCSRNTFVYDCGSNTFGNSCGANTFGKHCDGNTFGNSCVFNTFGDSCSRNTFGDSCTFNTFGSSCTFNTFGSSCTYNMFGKFCQYNKFGFQVFTMNYCKYNIIDCGCQYLNITGNGTASASNQLQNIHIHQGVKGTSDSNRKTITVDRGLSYETNIVPAGTITIEV